MTRNIGFGLLLNGDRKHSAQKVVAAHDGAFLLVFFLFLSHVAEGYQVMVGKQR
jgi:hypothetical protein